MIKTITLKNFTSFKDETNFTMEADLLSVSEHDNHYIRFLNNDAVLKVASIYGPNASGKSNFLKGFMYFKTVVLNGTKHLESREETAANKPIFNDFESFKFIDQIDNIISFNVSTINERYEIEYGVEIKITDNEEVIVYSESFAYKNIGDESSEFIVLFERNNSNITYSDKLEKIFSVFSDTISDKLTIISFLDEFFISSMEKEIKGLDVVRSFILELKSITFIKYRNPSQHHQYNLLRQMLKNTSHKNDIITILNNIGINIFDIKVKNEGYNVDEIYFIRKSKNNSLYEIPLSNESDGTQKLMELIPVVLNKINDGGLLLIDEIDLHLHPKLVEEIIKIFTSNKNKMAQLIFTSHDILNMTNKLFRRDEIWFTTKENEFKSELFALTDIVNYKGEKVRKDAVYSKQYLEGRYGADPFIVQGKKFYDET